MPAPVRRSNRQSPRLLASRRDGDGAGSEPGNRLVWLAAAKGERVWGNAATVGTIALSTPRAWPRRSVGGVGLAPLRRSCVALILAGVKTVVIDIRVDTPFASFITRRGPVSP